MMFIFNDKKISKISMKSTLYGIIFWVLMEGGREPKAFQGRSVNRSVISTQTHSFLSNSAADFLLHRGRFRRALTSAASAFLSTG
jgi:hypothetical protein